MCLRSVGDRVTDVMIFKIFSPENLAKILAFFAQTTVRFCKNMIITLVFEKNANFFDENWQKSQKIVIITSTPDEENFRIHTMGGCLLWAVSRKLQRYQFFVIPYSTVK
jgi:hypothetical protein